MRRVKQTEGPLRVKSRHLRRNKRCPNGTHVFDPFFTTKSSGTGLGLSISQRIIEDHGGKLRLTKTDSNGCTFEITLPSVATSDSRGLGRKIDPAGV
jgi:Histidine kinase-, DNA gyrase B-, and HSP90-like ATPase